MSVMATNINGRANVTPRAFMKMLKANKLSIFHADHVPKANMGQYHALALQLVAKGVIALEVNDTSKIGTNKFNADHVGITLPNTSDGDGIVLPAYMLDHIYAGLTSM